MDEIYSLRIKGREYSAEFQKGEGWRSVLESVYGKEHAVCLCGTGGERKLAIKARADQFHLARYGNTGPQHRHTCRFHAQSPERSGRQCYESGVVVEVDGDDLRIKLARGLRVQQETKETTSASPVPPRAPGDKQPAIKILGLLHLLWTESGLNTWFPWFENRRDAARVAWRIQVTASRITSNRIRLNQVLLTSAIKGSPAAHSNTEKVNRAIKLGYRLVVVAPLAHYDEAKHQQLSRLPLSAPFGMPIMYLSQNRQEYVAKSFARELSVWRAGGRVMAVAQLNVRAGDHVSQADVLELGLMHVSERWIPLDSSYEATIETMLSEQGREFEKPLRFDADEFVSKPDFWLLDQKNDFPLEVFGMSTFEYLQSKATKTVQYDAKYTPTGWWSWDAAADPQGQQIPPFPEAD